MPEPKPRKDGKCARPGCTRRLPRSRNAKRYAGDWLELDPWCSSYCCRAFHGVSIPGDDDIEMAERRSEAGRRGKQAGPLSRAA
jgi:hypothetical protein